MLFVNLGIGALLAAAASFRVVSVFGPAAAAVAALPLINACLLSIYVFGEDDYRGGGISRWDAYRSPGGELDELFFLSVGLMVAAAASLAYAGLGGRERLFWGSAMVGALVCVILGTATFIGFTAN